MVKSETKAMSRADLDKLFEVTEDKKKRMGEFKGKRGIKLPVLGDKTGITIRPVFDKDQNGNATLVMTVKSDTEKLSRTNGVMQTLFCEEYENQGEVVTIPYPKTLDNAFVGWAAQNGKQWEDIAYKWFKVVAEEFDSNKAATGKAKGYRVIYRNDLNTVVDKPASGASLF